MVCKQLREDSLFFGFHQVGSTGVGALTMAFLILIVSCLVFVQKATTAPNKQISYLCIYICGFAAMS